MRKQIKDTPNLLKINKLVFMFMGILNLFQVFVWLMKSGERYSQEYFLGSLLNDWLPGFVTIAFCIGWLISWNSLERIEVVKSKRELLIIGLVWIAPLLITGFYSAMVWNSSMLKDMALVCLMGYLSGFFIRLSFLGMATAQNFQVVLWQT
jgi:hypothetical protein